MAKTHEELIRTITLDKEEQFVASPPNSWIYYHIIAINVHDGYFQLIGRPLVGLPWVFQIALKPVLIKDCVLSPEDIPSITTAADAAVMREFHKFEAEDAL